MSSQPSRRRVPSPHRLTLLRPAEPAPETSVARDARAAPARLDDAALLALALGHRGPRRARAVLDQAGGVGALTRSDPALVARSLGATGAARLCAVLELGHRALVAAADERRESLSSFDAVVAWARPRLALLSHEEVWLLCLDGRNGLVAARCVARGGMHGCALTPRDVLRPALREAASAIVLLHNHPSGDPTPSEEDLHMTRQLAAACGSVGLPLLDHVVVARTGAASLLELGAIRATR